MDDKGKTLDKIRNFHRTYVDKIALFLIVMIVIIWIVPLFLPLIPLDAQIAVTTGIILTVLALLIDYMVDIKKSVDGLYRISVHEDQEVTTKKLSEYIRSEGIKDAFLLEYSSKTVSGMLEELKRFGSNIYLLIRYPDENKIGSKQRMRICAEICDNHGFRFKDYKSLRIQCYKEEASFRGRKLGDLVNVGWYTHDIRGGGLSEKIFYALYEEGKNSNYNEQEGSVGEYEIWGHNNPTITVLANTEGGSFIKDAFDKIFANLWEKGATLEEVCKDCERRKKGKCSVEDAWLERVSQKDSPIKKIKSKN